MSADFQKALTFVLKWEGGWSDNPADPGGATMKGITLGTYTAWRKAHGWPVPSKADLKAITDAEVQDIYWANYWLASGADKLSWPLSLLHFDAAVNTGVGQAAKFLAACGGDWQRYMDLREAWYRSLQQFPVFGAGWLNRCKALRKEAAG